MKDSHKNLQLTGANYKGDRRELDFYPTPPECTIALMDFLKLNKTTIWEPACGNHAMSEVLESYGHHVISTDINMGVNYLTEKRECEAIITNPPFNLSQEFIEKALSEAKIVAFLLKSQYWHAKKRLSLFNNNSPAYVLPLTWRPDFLYQERKDGKKGSPTMEMAWTVWISGNTDTKYRILDKPKNKNVLTLDL